MSRTIFLAILILGELFLDNLTSRIVSISCPETSVANEHTPATVRKGEDVKHWIQCTKTVTVIQLRVLSKVRTCYFANYVIRVKLSWMSSQSKNTVTVLYSRMIRKIHKWTAIWYLFICRFKYNIRKRNWCACFGMNISSPKLLPIPFFFFKFDTLASSEFPRADFDLVSSVNWTKNSHNAS